MSDEDWNAAIGQLTAEMVGAVDEATKKGAEVAKSTHKFTNRSGNAERSIESVRASANTAGATGAVRCGVGYGAVLANGSKPHVIAARNGGVLRFRGKDGQWVSKHEVQHPGTKADPFMDNAAEVAESTLVEAVDRAVAKVFE